MMYRMYFPIDLPYNFEPCHVGKYTVPPTMDPSWYCAPWSHALPGSCWRIRDFPRGSVGRRRWQGTSPKTKEMITKMMVWKRRAPLTRHAPSNGTYATADTYWTATTNAIPTDTKAGLQSIYVTPMPVLETYLLVRWGLMGQNLNPSQAVHSTIGSRCSVSKFRRLSPNITMDRVLPGDMLVDHLLGWTMSWLITATQIFEEFGLKLNEEPGKTEAVMHYRGSHSIVKRLPKPLWPTWATWQRSIEVQRFAKSGQEDSDSTAASEVRDQRKATPEPKPAEVRDWTAMFVSEFFKDGFLFLCYGLQLSWYNILSDGPTRSRDQCKGR